MTWRSVPFARGMEWLQRYNTGGSEVRAYISMFGRPPCLSCSCNRSVPCAAGANQPTESAVDIPVVCVCLCCSDSCVRLLGCKRPQVALDGLLLLLLKRSNPTPLTAALHACLVVSSAGNIAVCIVQSPLCTCLIWQYHVAGPFWKRPFLQCSCRRRASVCCASTS
jgi:hypothetical protein